MDLKEIMSVSGHSGLFKFVSQGRNGIIVESFVDNKRMFVSASQKVSALSDIAIFTEGEEVPLKDVMRNIHNLMPGEHAPDAKIASPDDLKQFMEKVLPEYDRNRVYISDIKKLVSWYNALLDLNILQFEEPVKETEQNEGKNESNEAIKEEVTVKPKAKTTTKTKEKAPAKKSPVKK